MLHVVSALLVWRPREASLHTPHLAGTAGRLAQLACSSLHGRSGLSSWPVRQSSQGSIRILTVLLVRAATVQPDSQAEEGDLRLEGCETRWPSLSAVAHTCSIASGDPVTVTEGRAALTAHCQEQGPFSPFRFSRNASAAHPASPPCPTACTPGHGDILSLPRSRAQRGVASRALSSHCTRRVVRTTRTRFSPPPSSGSASSGTFGPVQWM